MRFQGISRTSAVAIVAAAIATGAAAQNFDLEPRIGFPDFKFMPPPSEHSGEVFVLSADFPADLPDPDPAVEDILSHDFQGDPIGYAMKVRDYVFAGNIKGNGDVSGDFVLHNNAAGHDWYHVPWQHWGSAGREGYHGLTREGPLSPKVLAPTQTDGSSAYAVGFYNNLGGWTIGQVWRDADSGPDLSRFIAGEGFAEGTVVGKFLFTVLGDDQVPFLRNPLQWNAYMYDCDVPGLAPEKCGRLTGDEPHSTQQVNLLQMDIMVKDSRAEEAGGWVFGTFVYNGALPRGHAYSAACEGFVGDSARWCNLMPVGLMWGNDPQNAMSYVNAEPTATRRPIGALLQTRINGDPDLPAMHLGFNSRLNGPADNPASSCMSCHATGQYPSVSAIMPFLPPNSLDTPENGTEASAEWMRWFRNFAPGEAFDAGQAVSMDFSMQLTKSIENYVQYRSGIQGGRYAVEYAGSGDDSPISRGAEPLN